MFSGWKPCWIRAETLKPLEDEDDGMGVEGDNKSDGNEDLVLTKTEAWVVANNARLHA